MNFLRKRIFPTLESLSAVVAHSVCGLNSLEILLNYECQINIFLLPLTHSPFTLIIRFFLMREMECFLCVQKKSFLFAKKAAERKTIISYHAIDFCDGISFIYHTEIFMDRKRLFLKLLRRIFRITQRSK